MQVSVTGKNTDIGDALRGHVENGLTATVSKYFDNAMEAQVVFSREGRRFHTDISVHVGRGILLQGRADADDPYLSFNSAADHIAKRLRRHKRRLRDHHGKVARQTERLIAREYVVAPEPAATGAGAAEDNPAIIAEMDAEIATLTVGEAVMRMDLADLPALMFRNIAHGGLNMIYRRPDGTIGWVDPRGTRERTQ